MLSTTVVDARSVERKAGSDNGRDNSRDNTMPSV